MSTREAQLQEFLTLAGWGNAERGILADDASFRTYDRLRRGDDRAVLMNAPPEHEDVRPFVKIARHLKGLGYSAPGILAEDIENGFLLLEDLGDDTFTRLLNNGTEERALYELACDLLIDLHKRPATEALPPGLPGYGNGRLLDEVFLLPIWWAPEALGAPFDEEQRRAYGEIWLSLFPEIHKLGKTLVLRDFHVDNLIRLDGRSGIQACGLLDFQDAVAGAAAYDLMSLLEDARRDINVDLQNRILDRYFRAFPNLDRDAFMTAYKILAAGRHAKVIGIFTRLCVRDGKPRYLHHIPRVWRLFEEALTHPALAEIAQWVDSHIPADRRGIPQNLIDQGTETAS